MDLFVCVNCGATATSLYKEYSTGVLKICFCDTCKKPVDQYIETDTSVVLIDAALQRLESYRHFIYNKPPKHGWKFGFICILCDAYTKWFSKKKEMGNLQSYLELEWTFYIACIQSILDNLVFFTILWCLILIFLRSSKIRPKSVMASLLTVAGCGKLFTIPSVLWGLDSGQTNEYLIYGFVLTSLIQTCRVLNVKNRIVAILLVLTAFSGQTLTNYAYS